MDPIAPFVAFAILLTAFMTVVLMMFPAMSEVDIMKIEHVTTQHLFGNNLTLFVEILLYFLINAVLLSKELLFRLFIIDYLPDESIALVLR